MREEDKVLARERGIMEQVLVTDSLIWHSKALIYRHVLKSGPSDIGRHGVWSETRCAFLIYTYK